MTFWAIAFIYLHLSSDDIVLLRKMTFIMALSNGWSHQRLLWSYKRLWKDVTERNMGTELFWQIAGSISHHTFTYYQHNATSQSDNVTFLNSCFTFLRFKPIFGIRYPSEKGFTPKTQCQNNSVPFFIRLHILQRNVHFLMQRRLTPWF